MSRFAAVAGIALALLFAARAEAATFHFQAVATTATAICPAPCYQIRMFYEDPTRSLLLFALQFDVEPFGSATLGTLPSNPPAENSNIATGRTQVEDLDGNVRRIPWDLSDGLGRSPIASNTVLVLAASSELLSVDTLQTLRDSAVGCTPSSTCAIQLDGLLNDRIYLGRFSVTWNGGPVGLQLDRVSSLGADFESVESLQALEGAELAIEGLPSFDPVDSDGDGSIDGHDNCPSVPNPGQENLDRDEFGDVCDLCPAYPTTENGDVDANGIGDACECGDQTGDGVVDTRDLFAINLAIFGQMIPSPLCDTNDDGACNVKDILGAHAKILGRPAYCQRYPAPPPPPPSPPGANLVSLDLQSAGDGWITHDLDTGLQWLDPGVTQDTSFDQILASDWIAEGWRHATHAEICSLVERVTGPAYGCSTTDQENAYEGVVRLQGFLGAAGSLETSGLFATGQAQWGHSATNEVGLVIVVNQPYDPDVANPAFGHFLVRTAP